MTASISGQPRRAEVEGWRLTAAGNASDVGASRRITARTGKKKKNRHGNVNSAGRFGEHLQTTPGDPPTAIARAKIVDPSVTPWSHCVTRCVRRAFLLGEGPDDRKEWIENRMRELAEVFAIAIGGFSVLDNHLHLLVRLGPDIAKDWSDEEVVRRWERPFPPRDKFQQPLPVSDDWIQWRLIDAGWVATARERLQSLSWFMKCLKESRRAGAGHPAR